VAVEFFLFAELSSRSFPPPVSQDLKLNEHEEVIATELILTDDIKVSFEGSTFPPSLGPRTERLPHQPDYYSPPPWWLQISEGWRR